MQSTIAPSTTHTQSFPAGVKQAKVIGVHREDHSVDIAFMDGSIARNVPVLSGWMGSAYGIAGLTAPSYDPEVLAKKTYPANQQATKPTANSAITRDQYAAVLQMEGHGFGTGGYVVLGFYAPQVSEMLFPRGESEEFSDMLLIRHPSDVQTTVDKAGKVSIQHPTGTRITIGMGSVDLTKQDYDQRYEIRHNTEALKDIEAVAMGSEEEEASLYLKTVGQAKLYGRQLVRLHTKTSTNIEMDDGGHIDIWASGSITLHTDGGATITLAGGEITISAPGTVAVSGSEITLN